LTTLDLPVETVWLEPETGKRLSTLSTCLGISTSSGNREIATEFIDYVLSEKVQKKISETYAAGIRKSVIDIPIPENKYTYDNAGIENFIIFQIRDLYKKVANGTMSTEEATQKALERYI
jgi:ABC-type glycerol-3-phosphate transport system substrate-binding protein